jgi:hypothetical protein
MDIAAAGDLDDAWERYLGNLQRLREAARDPVLLREPQDRVRADYWLLQAQAAAFSLVMAPRTSAPRFYTSTLFERTAFTWLLPNPDFNYRYTFLDGRQSYRIRGTVGSPHFFDAQVSTGFWGEPGAAIFGNHDITAFADASGRIDLYVGAQAPADGRPWLPIDAHSSNNFLLMREAFYDWQRDQPSRLRIDLADDVDRDPVPLDEPELIRRLDAIWRNLQFCWDFFSGGFVKGVLKAAGTNAFHHVNTSSGEDGSHPTAGYVPAVYELADDEALVVTFAPRSTRYWSLQLGDLWMQTTDFIDRQSSLNGAQAPADADGLVRLVVSARDPGVPNWLDTAGLRTGVALFRWYFGAVTPPTAQRMPLAAVRDALPAATPAVTKAERAVALRERREAISARLPC